MKVLIVEDDKTIRNFVAQGLKEEGFAVFSAADGKAGLDLALSGDFDLIILDLNLPKIDGLAVCRTLREKEFKTPILMLTARDSLENKIEGFDAGADDYLVKPFDLDELTARIRALLRRRSGRSEPVIRHREIMLDPAAHVVTRDGQPVELPPREFAVLQQLLEHRGRVLSRAQLEQNLYSWKDEVDSNAVEVHIHHLRRKLGAELIRTIRGVGYVIDKEA